MAERYKIAIVLGAGCGLRQGEMFGVSPDDFDREAGVLHVVRQVRLVGGKQVFALPKRNKTRDVPVAMSVLRLLDEHMERFPPPAVTLPWRTPAGSPHTARLLLTDDHGRPLWRNKLNERIWDPARRAAGISNPTRQDGTHALRHHFASVLLDAGKEHQGALRVPRAPRSGLHAPDLHASDAEQRRADAARHRRSVRRTGPRP
jgi:integrase